jgi:hypothetical protein
MKKVLFIAIVALLIGCGKKAHKVDPNYVGKWVGQDDKHTYILVVQDGERGEWTKSDKALFSGSTKTINGHVRVSGNTLRVGLKKLSLDQEPQQFGNIYTMVLDGVNYYK